jgi:DNA polymerase III delta subunit
MSGKVSASSEQAVALSRFSSGGSFMLLLAPDEIRRERFITELQITIRVGSSATEVVRASELTVRRLHEIKDRLLTGSLFSSRLLFHFKEIQDLPEAIQAEICKIIASLPPSNFLLCSGKSLKRSSVLYKCAMKRDAIIEMTELNEAEVLSWSRQELKRVGLLPKTGVAEIITSLGESRPDRILAIIEKLSLYLEQGSVVTDSDIGELFPTEAPATEFALVDSILLGDTVGVEKLLRKLLALGKSEFAIHGLLVSTFLRYLRIRIYLDQKLSPSLIQKELSIQPWLFKRSLASVSKISTSQLRRALEKLLTAEGRLKGRSLDAETIMSELSAGLYR